MKDKHCIDCKGIIHPKSIRCVPCRNRMISKSNSGSNNKQYKGELASYKTKHQKINSKYGKANKCENIRCLKKSIFFEWANISGEYKRGREDWIMLCHSCNVIMDYFRRHGNKCKKGHEYTIENTRINKEGKRNCLTCIKNRSI